MVIRQAHEPLRDLLILGIRLGLIPVAGLADPEHLAGQLNRYGAFIERSFGHLAASLRPHHISANACNDPAESAQLRPLVHMLQRASSCMSTATQFS
jgi:hypothetical protein